MSCNVDGTNEVQSTTHPRARKEHKCCACREAIRVGDRYSRTFVVYDGDAETFIHCARCWAIFEAICAAQRDLDFDWYERGVAWQLDCGHDWQEVFHEEPPPEVARLAFMTPDEAQALLASGHIR